MHERRGWNDQRNGRHRCSRASEPGWPCGRPVRPQSFPASQEVGQIAVAPRGRPTWPSDREAVHFGIWSLRQGYCMRSGPGRSRFVRFLEAICGQSDPLVCCQVHYRQPGSDRLQRSWPASFDGPVGHKLRQHHGPWLTPRSWHAPMVRASVRFIRPAPSSGFSR